jgi:bacterial/archaeal transporter family-2 protein
MSLVNGYLLFIVLALLAGMAVPVQATLNSRLSDSLGSPIVGAFYAMAIGAIVLFIVMLLSGASFANLSTLRQTPWIFWVGGFFGAFFVASMAITVPKIGVGLALALTVAGQMLLAIVIDHFGWMEMEQKTISVWRVVGAALITVGVILIKRF